MGNYLKLFDTHSEYVAFTQTEDFILPNVSHCIDNNEVHYNPILSYREQYFTVEALESGLFNIYLDDTYSYVGNHPESITSYLEYSIDGGTTWVRASYIEDEYSSTTPITLNEGDKVLIRGINNSLGAMAWDSQQNIAGFDFKSNQDEPKRFNVYGNILSLLYGDNFINQTTLPFYEVGEGYGEYGRHFAKLFDQSGIVSAENLILPNDVAINCYYGLFMRCTNLITPPKLPATTLEEYCYTYMFDRCSSLETAPELPATTLANYCYQGMFRDCSLLNSVKCLATDISAISCTNDWLNNVAATGTFTKAASMSSWTTGADGIPNGWTIENAS